MIGRPLAHIAQTERRIVRRRRRWRHWSAVRPWAEGLGIALGLALLAAIGHALTGGMVR